MEGSRLNSGPENKPIDWDARLSNALARATAVLSRKNGEHEIAGVVSLDKKDIERFLNYSTSELKKLNDKGVGMGSPHYIYHQQVIFWLTDLLEALSHIETKS